MHLGQHHLYAKISFFNIYRPQGAQSLVREKQVNKYTVTTKHDQLLSMLSTSVESRVEINQGKKGASERAQSMRNSTEAKMDVVNSMKC